MTTQNGYSSEMTNCSFCKAVKEVRRYYLYVDRTYDRPDINEFVIIKYCRECGIENPYAMGYAAALRDVEEATMREVRITNLILENANTWNDGYNDCFVKALSTIKTLGGKEHDVPVITCKCFCHEKDGLTVCPDCEPIHKITDYPLRTTKEQ